MSLSHDEAISEEIAQETFFKALKSLKSFKGDCEIRVWLCQIAKNTFYTYCKKRKRTDIIENIESDNLEQSIWSRLDDTEQAKDIYQILHTMDEPYKEVFMLRVFGELSFRHIGNLFGKSEAWARVTYHRSKKKIIAQLKLSERGEKYDAL